MRLLLTLIAVVLVSCTHTVTKDGFTRFKEASEAGENCGRQLKKLSVPEEAVTWSPSQQQSVEYAYNSCLSSYKTLSTHAAAVEFVKGVFTEIGIKYKETSEKGSVLLVGSLDPTGNKETVMMVHATDMGNAQLINQGEKLNSLWGQTTASSRALGVLQMMALAFAKKHNVEERAYNLALAVSEQGQWKGIAAEFTKINVVLNEGGHAFSKQNKNMFLIGSEQKGGAWLRIKHKSPNRLLSHLDSLMAVFMPHEPRDFNGPGKCQLLSLNTVDQKINVIPNEVSVSLKCKGISAVTVGQAFSHPNMEIRGRNEGNIYRFTLTIAHPGENKYGQLSALQIAAQGLQKLSIIPFRDWSFEEPQFYGHQRTPASIDFVKSAKKVYSQQSDWGGLLWDLDGAGEWSNLSSEITPEKRDGPEKLFRTGCTWTGFYADLDGAEALVDCRLARMHNRVPTSEDQDAQDFAQILRTRAKDPGLEIDVVKGWNSISSENNHRFVQFAKDQIHKIYPSSETATWISPSATVVYSGNSVAPTYGFNPLLREDILDTESEKPVTPEQVFAANQIYSGAVIRLLQKVR
ncbi:MAG: hypothetical protein H6623_09130 [Bdellovibrionaceae bacterium]|nr:hypothetical protein [Pseudobdellovibrionaceae bacterium]